MLTLIRAFMLSSRAPTAVPGWSTNCGGAVLCRQGKSGEVDARQRLRARHKRRYKATTDSKHGLAVADNLLDRNFTPSVPHQVWTSDITCLWTDEGWLYLAIVLDLFNREVVGWSIKRKRPAAPPVAFH